MNKDLRPTLTIPRISGDGDNVLKVAVPGLGYERRFSTLLRPSLPYILVGFLWVYSYPLDGYFPEVRLSSHHSELMTVECYINE